MNFQRCYELIGLPPGCSWEELQTGYRRQVQKWHPDRHEQDPEQQRLASQRMLELNEAYAVLSEFQRQYGYLPAQPPSSESAPAPAPSPAPAAAAPRRTRGTMRSTRVRKTYAVSPWLLISAILLGSYFLFIDLIPDDLGGPPSGSVLPTPDAQPIPKRGNKQLDSDTATQSKVAQKGLEAESTFTYGDLPGWVYEVEGIPTRTSGDLWFYGTSEVLFADGKVVSWYSSPEHPLKVRGSPEPPPRKPSEMSQPDR